MSEEHVAGVGTELRNAARRQRGMSGDGVVRSFSETTMAKELDTYDRVREDRWAADADFKYGRLPADKYYDKIKWCSERVMLIRKGRPLMLAVPTKLNPTPGW